MILTHGASSLKVEYDSKVTIGGRDYPVVKIGNQLWLAENLDWKFEGCVIGASGTSTSESRANYYDNDEITYGITGKKCGLLYNWCAAKYLDDNKDTLLPDGWHVPSNSEWNTLATNVGGNSTAGTKLKAANVSWATSWGGTDDYGFAALPAGGRYSTSFYYVGFYARFWTATEYSSTLAYYCGFDTGASIDSNGYNNTYNSFSVRLVKDA